MMPKGRLATRRGAWNAATISVSCPEGGFSMVKPFRALRGALFASALVAVPAAAADTYSQTVFFGDSLTDAGFFRPLLPANVQSITGQFTTNPGDVWAQLLADYYGTQSDPNGNGQTGTNYAAGGARVGVDVLGGPLGPIPSLSTQVNAYLAANGGVADPDALYTVWGGANDLFTVTNAGANPAVVVPAAIAAEVGIIQGLTNAGAEYILVPTVPDFGATPAFIAQGPVAQAQGTALVTSYNTGLFSAINAAGLKVIPLNTFDLIQEIAASPAEYGFTNVTSTACTVSNSLLCNPTTLVSPDAPLTYAFADGVHPTTGAHRIIAQYAVSVLEAPRQISQLSHYATVTGRSRMERVAQHVVDRESEGLRWWLNGRFDEQSKQIADYRGRALLAGLDFTSGDLVAGIFGGYGRTRFDLDALSGDATQGELTGGLFAGYYGSTFWANGQLSYTRLNNKVKRDVRLGAATRTHSGSPDGRNVTGALQAGADFAFGSLTAGPVASLIAQRVRVDGYSESNGELSTALRYGKQKLNSLIGSAGLQASYALDETTSPYLRATFDREFKEGGRDPEARLQTIETQAFTVPGIDRDRSYGTITAGVRTSVLGLDANLGGSTTLGREGGQDLSGFLTIGQRF
ncbi:MAG TPA: autotransporter domain-containing protein [Sphingomicrobium sp.]|nr:autotransporter domain-containing protein [Sphingomicrobium sp.]